MKAPWKASPISPAGRCWGPPGTACPPVSNYSVQVTFPEPSSFVSSKKVIVVTPSGRRGGDGGPLQISETLPGVGGDRWVCSACHSQAPAKQDQLSAGDAPPASPRRRMGWVPNTRAANVQSLGEAPRQRGARAGAAPAGHSDLPAVQSTALHNQARPCYGTEWTGLERRHKRGLWEVSPDGAAS